MVTDYHFHLYFSARSRASAATIRERLMRQEQFAVRTGPLVDGPIGPHFVPQFQATVLPIDLEAALRWYMFNHGDHVVLVHPNSGDEVSDHGVHALWMGERLPLDEDKLGQPRSSCLPQRQLV